MKWIVIFTLVVSAGLFSYQAPDLQFRYPRVESYEIRPGILATPVYSSNGVLCQISFEQRHVQKDAVHMQSDMPRDLVLEIVNELAPAYVRGKPLWHIGQYEYLDIISGDSATSVANYDNVSIQIHRMRAGSGDAAVIIEWKHACDSSKQATPAPE